MIMSALAFILGAYLSIQIIAALYRILDLWYAIGREYPSVIRGLMLWVGLGVFVAWVGPEYRGAFLKGLVGYLVFYVGVYLLRGVVLSPRLRKGR